MPIAESTLRRVTLCVRPIFYRYRDRRLALAERCVSGVLNVATSTQMILMMNALLAVKYGFAASA
jgi:hypothetical protein